MAKNIIVIGGSAGALQALKTLVAALPSDLSVPVFVTVHVAAEFPSILAEILSSCGKLPARHPSSHEPIRPGVIYVAPPDYHMLVERDFVLLNRGPRENRHRPSIDVLFRSAARSYGSRTIGIVLSGELDDGSAGLMAIGMRGGVRIVQDPSEAMSPEMPSNAIQYAGADFIVPVAEVANLIARASRGEHLQPEHPRSSETAMNDRIDKEVREVEMKDDPSSERPGKPSQFACPECHGVLWELDDEGLLRFRCRVGHAYTADALSFAMSEAGENALWAAMRALEEKAALLRRMSHRTGQRLANRYNEEAESYDRYVLEIRKMLAENQASSGGEASKEVA